MDKLLEISELILSEHNTGIPFKNLEKPLILNNEDEAYTTDEVGDYIVNFIINN